MTTNTQAEIERAAFEAHFSSISQKDEDGDYLNRSLESAWVGWQARAALQKPAEREWISVKDRLPQKRKDYLVSLSTGAVTCARFNDGDWESPSTMYTDDTYVGIYIEGVVKHWAEMPAAPLVEVKK